MRYSQPERMQIIRLVEESELPNARSVLELDMPRSTFYRWYQRYQEAGYDGLADKKPAPRQFWNRIPAFVRDHVVEVTLEQLEKSPRQLAWHITDNEECFISESSVYRILKDFNLVASSAFQIISASCTCSQNPCDTKGG